MKCAIPSSSHMLQRQTWLFVNDNTNIRWLKIFHLYKGFFRKKTFISFFVKGAAKVVEPPRLEYKGFKYKYNLKGDIARSIIVRSRFQTTYADNATIRFNSNAGFILKKKFEPKSKFIQGPITRTVFRKKLLSLFKVVI